MDAIEQGVVTKTTKERLLELEGAKENLEHDIMLERAKADLAEDEHTIAAYFERFAGEAIAPGQGNGVKFEPLSQGSANFPF